MRLQRQRPKAPTVLPAELIHLILDEVVRAEDIPTLKAMSLVCSWFRPRCRSGLFRRVTVALASDGHYSAGSHHSRNELRLFNGLISFLDAKPDIVRSIRHLVLLDLSRIWSIPGGPPTWTAVSLPLCRLLARLKGLHGLEIRSEIQLDWATFDTAIKQSIYSIFRRPPAITVPGDTQMPHLRIAGVVNIRDVDIWRLFTCAPALSITQACFSLQGPESKSPAGHSSFDMLAWNTPEILRLGRGMGDNALDMVRHYPGLLGRVRSLAIESLSAAAAVSQFWAVALASRETLEHLEWLFEDLAYRTQQDARELQRLDLSVFPRLRSICIRSSQTGLLVNLMVILEATGVENRIERIKIIMPDYVDKFVAFVPSMVWKRLDTVLGGEKFKPHLRQVVLSFTCEHRTISSRSLQTIAASLRRNLPSVSGKRFCVVQERHSTG